MIAEEHLRFDGTLPGCTYGQPPCSLGDGRDREEPGTAVAQATSVSTIGSNVPMMPTTSDRLLPRHNSSLSAPVPQLRSTKALCRAVRDRLDPRNALRADGKGRVLVVDGGGSLKVAVLGDGIATMAVENCRAGTVVRGAIRDSAVNFGLSISV